MPVPDKQTPVGKPPPKWKLYQTRLKALGTLFRRTRTPNRNQTTAINSSPFPLLRLPREIREQIYRDLLTVSDDGALWLRYSLNRHQWWDATPLCQAPGPRLPRPRVTLGLLLTCKTIREEALPILFKSNRIWLDAPPAKCLEFLASLPPNVSGGIRHMKLWIDAYLNCGRSTGNLPNIAPEDREVHRARVEVELLTAWSDLFAWMQGNVALLKTLHVRFGPRRSWHARNVGAVSVEWQRFYRQGWIEKVWETRQIERVLVEAGLEWCDQMDDRERESLRELRGDIQCVPGFEEVSLEWEHSFFLSSACEQFPQTSLCIWLQRSEGLVDGGRERRLGVDEWPEYKPVYTLDDMIFPWVCGFCTEQPPRSPNNSR